MAPYLDEAEACQDGRQRILKCVRWRWQVDASRTMPYEVDAWRLLCRSYFKQKKAESALYVCSRAHDLSPHLSDVQESLDWSRKEVASIQQDREGRERLERQTRERQAREKQKEQEKKKDEWKWMGGDGEWHHGKGGGRGNKRGGSHNKKGPEAKRGPRGLYDILELKPSCTKSEIKKAYHRLSLKFHPDKNPDKEVSLPFQFPSFFIVYINHMRVHMDT